MYHRVLQVGDLGLRRCSATVMNSLVASSKCLRFKLPDPGFAWESGGSDWHWSWRSLGQWFGRNKIELGVVVLLTILAGILRVYRLADLPGGLHGDEALTGLDARRVIDEGWIGPYVGSALGQPTGPIYFTAFVFKLAGESLFTLHLSMALLGIVTIPAAYVMFRMSFGQWVAVLGTIALTFSYWHLFFSRSAFMLISMPLMTVLAASTVLMAIRSKRLPAWLFAGAVLGLGVYSYNGYAMFVAAIAVLLIVMIIPGRNQLGHYTRGSAILIAGFLVTAFPLLQVVYADPNFYFQHHRMVSVLQEPNYQAAETLGERIQYFGGRAWDAARLPLRNPEIDYVDGLGGRGALQPILGWLAYAGFLISVTRWRSPPHLLMAVVFVLGLATMMLGTDDLGEFRRPFVIVPFVYGLAGVAVATGGGYAARLVGGRAGRLIGYGGGTATIFVAALLSAWTYFGEVAHEEHLDWVYASDLVDALNDAHTHGDPGTVYFYSDRWSYDYETRRFLYPDTPGIDRSNAFGEFSLQRLSEGPVTYILLPPYTGNLNALMTLHPGGDVSEARTADGARRFVNYHLRSVGGRAYG